MKQSSKINDVSISKPLLIVGEFKAFQPDVQTLIRQYEHKILTELPPVHSPIKYSVIIFSPGFQCAPEQLQSDRNFFYLSFSDKVQGDIQIVPPFSCQQFKACLNSARQYHLARIALRQVEKQHLIVSKERENLSAIGVALSAEKNLDKLLGLVLKEGRSLGKCEGASLYLIEKSSNGEAELVFKLTQNSKISFDFREVRFPLTNQSLAGYVALSREMLNISDVYNLNDGYPFSFDKSFDEKVNYRSKELLVLPMKNHKGKVIGVLQFVNTFGHDPMFDPLNEHVKQDPGFDCDEKNIDCNEKKQNRGFSKTKQGLLEGLASQAAVAIDNSHLIENIQNLFEGFVSASVNAIESRDPVTSGHSFRVAELTTGLAEMLDKETSGVHKNLSFNHEQIRELRYASLLHDFGKVGVKENVLLKANKLHASRYQYLELKIDWQKQILEKKYYHQLLNEGHKFEQHNFLISDVKKMKFSNNSAHRDLLAELDKLDKYKQLLFQANKPSLMEENVAEELAHMAGYKLNQEYPFSTRLLNDADFLSLSTSKGSLTDKERRKIQSHVVHTQKFLERIPWTDELAAIPAIAGAHHEKLDGTGYPLGLQSHDIPLPSKIMAIADIFDALTATDRPYKKSVGLELSLDILSQEAKSGKLDQDILQTFIQSKVYQRVL